MKRGFPRPRGFVKRTVTHPSGGSYGKKWDNREYPWPYSASSNTISNISEGRMRECALFKRCGTCGDPVKEDLVGLIIYNVNSAYCVNYNTKIKKSARPILNTESGPYHLKCLALNFTMCPHLAKTKHFEPAVGLWSEVRNQVLECWK
jgi:hypothetical protein